MRKPVTMLRRGKETWAEGERVVGLRCWRNDGQSYPVKSNGFGHEPGLHTISIGRTDSQTRLGFVITTAKGKRITDFTLSRDQVTELRHFLDYQFRRMKKNRKSR